MREKETALCAELIKKKSGKRKRLSKKKMTLTAFRLQEINCAKLLNEG